MSSKKKGGAKRERSRRCLIVRGCGRQQRMRPRNWRMQKEAEETSRVAAAQAAHEEAQVASLSGSTAAAALSVSCLLLCAYVSACRSFRRVTLPSPSQGRSQAGANSKAKQKVPGAHPKPFDPSATPNRAVLRFDNSHAVLKGPATVQALKTNAVQMERLKGGKTVCVQQGKHIAHKFESGWEVGVIKAFDLEGPSRWQVQLEVQG